MIFALTQGFRGNYNQFPTSNSTYTCVPLNGHHQTSLAGTPSPPYRFFTALFCSADIDTDWPVVWSRCCWWWRKAAPVSPPGCQSPPSCPSLLCSRHSLKSEQKYSWRGTLQRRKAEKDQRLGSGFIDSGSRSSILGPNPGFLMTKNWKNLKLKNLFIFFWLKLQFRVLIPRPP